MERGEAPVYKTKKARREENLVNSYEALKKTGQVDKAIRKLNKKHVKRDHNLVGNREGTS